MKNAIFEMKPAHITACNNRATWHKMKQHICGRGEYKRPYFICKFICCLESKDGSHIIIYNEKRKMVFVYRYPDFSKTTNMLTQKK